MDYKYLDKRNIHYSHAKIQQRRISFKRLAVLILMAIIIMFISLNIYNYYSSIPKSTSSTIIDEILLPSEPEETEIEKLETPEPINNETAQTITKKKNKASLPAITWEEVKVERGDTLVEILSNYKIARSEVHQLLSEPKSKKILANLKPGQLLRFSYNQDYELQVLVHHVSPNRVITFTRRKNQFAIKVDEKKPESRYVRAKGVISQSLYDSAHKANIPDKVTLQLTQLFKQKINFTKDLKPGDYFIVLYEQDYLGNKIHNVGNIVAAEFVSKNTTHKIIRFKMGNEPARYYSVDGESLHHAFSRAPLQYRRISSAFNPSRKHPILGFTRPHWGVDLSAPAGTPVKASGDGKVTFSGKQGGYGNLVTIDHGDKITTWYAHLKKVAPGIRNGSHVKHGQVIGYVGSTGLASGPHLHYEYRIANTPKNPMTVKLPKGSKIPSTHLAKFKSQAQQLMAQLHNENTMIAEAKTEKSTG